MAEQRTTSAPIDMAPHDDNAASSGETWEARLTSALTEQESIVERLESLGARQARAIEGRVSDELLSILGERQSLIESFAGTQQVVVSMAESLRDDPSLIDAETRAGVRERINAISGRLNSVMERDARDQALLEEAAASVKTELNQAGVARQAHRAYGGQRGDGNRYADTQG